MSHPLNGCYLRIQRAGRYIEEAESLVRDFESMCEDSIIASANAPIAGAVPIQFPDVPLDLPLAVSDAVHNLRAALDYLVYELAIHDSKAIQEGTQFPIEPVKCGVSPNGNRFGFDAVVDRYLKGVSPPHRDAIELLQPYKSGPWTLTLKDISNPDKHRRLTRTVRGDVVSVWVHSPRSEGKKLPSGDTIRADATHTILIALPEGELPVVPTLERLQAAIIDTVNNFRPEFA